MGHSRPLLLYFRLFALHLVDKILAMVGFEPRISGVRSDRSTNWATNTAPYPIELISPIGFIKLSASLYIRQ